jgi:hypothetical protein
LQRHGAVHGIAMSSGAICHARRLRWHRPTAMIDLND